MQPRHILGIFGFIVSSIMVFMWVLYGITKQTHYDMVIHTEYYNDTIFTITNVNNNSYRCCVMNGCRCRQSTSLYSCRYMLNNSLDGECDGGGSCCEYSRDRSYCIRYISHTDCQSYCSLCYRPIMEFYYIANNTNITISKSKSCAIDDINCGRSITSNYHNGMMINGSYNVSNIRDIRFNVRGNVNTTIKKERDHKSPNKIYMRVGIVFTVIVLFTLIIIVGIAIDDYNINQYPIDLNIININSVSRVNRVDRIIINGIIFNLNDPREEKDIANQMCVICHETNTITYKICSTCTSVYMCLICIRQYAHVRRVCPQCRGDIDIQYV